MSRLTKSISTKSQAARAVPQPRSRNSPATGRAEPNPSASSCGVLTDAALSRARFDTFDARLCYRPEIRERANDLRAANGGTWPAAMALAIDEHLLAWRRKNPGQWLASRSPERKPMARTTTI